VVGSARAQRADALAHHVSACAALQTCQVCADLDPEQVLGRLACEPQARVRIAGRRTDDGLWAYTVLEVVTGEAAVSRIREYPTALSWGSTQTEANRFWTALLQKAQRLSTESVPSM